MRCPNCKLDQPDGSRTCSQCGTALARACPRCGFDNPAGFKFCGQCAAPLAPLAPLTPASTPAVRAPAAAPSAPGASPPPVAPAAPSVDRQSPLPPAPLPSQRSSEASLVLPADLADAGERRRVTVLFCDLVGAAQLSQRLDPEDMHRVVRAYQAAAEAVIERHGGYVAQYLGDGLLVYFGYPEEREDSARSAVLAALEIVDAVSGLAARLDATRGVDIAARIGMHSGEGVAGDVGGKLKVEQLVVGRAPNIAARLLGLASPGTVLASEATRALVADDVETLSLGARNLKGIAEPIGVYRILSRKQAPLSSPGLRAQAVPFVGPRGSLDALVAAAHAALAGKGVAALVSGAEGSGKSRLVRELRAALAGSDVDVWVARCRAKAKSAQLEPFTAVISRIVAGDEPPPEAGRQLTVEASADFVQPPRDAAALERAFGDAFSDERAHSVAMGPQATPNPSALRVHLVGALLGSPAEALPPIEPLTPLARAENTRLALADLFIALANRRATVLVVEDLQLADPSSLALFAELAARAPSARLLLCGTYAPPFALPVAIASPLRIDVEPLAKGPAAELIRVATAPFGLAPDVEARILERAGGLPLHILELSRAASRALSDSRAAPQGPGGREILLDLRGAVLDALAGAGPAREVAWMASVLGPRFERDVLGVLCPFDPAMVKHFLDVLTDAGILAAEEGAEPSFSHSLVRDAVYESLAPVRRRDAHEKAARAIARRPGAANARFSIVAWHLERAGLAEEAAQYLAEAAQRELSAGATVEALSLYDRALDLVTTNLDGARRLRLEVELRTARAEALLDAVGASTPGLSQHLTRAKELCKRVDAPNELLRIVRGQWLVARWQGNAPAVIAHAEELAALAARSADPEWKRFAGLAGANTSCYRGRLKDARADIGRVLAGERDLTRLSRRGMLSEDVVVAALALRAWIEGIEGARSAALATLEEAGRVAAELPDPVGATRVAVTVMIVHHDLDEPQAALEAARRALERAQRQHIAIFGAPARCVLGWALGRSGAAAEGIAEIERGLAVFRSSGRKIELAYWIGHLADVCLQDGRLDAAARAIDEAVGLTGSQLDAVFKPEILRLQGDLMAARERDLERASALYQRAAETARAYGAMPWALAATARLARAQAELGRRDDAVAALTAALSVAAGAKEASQYSAAMAALKELSRAP